MSTVVHVVDTGCLIDEVKKRPGLYDKVVDVDKDEKMTLWKEVGAVVYKDWSRLTKAEAYDRVLELQRKWRSVKDALNRELRIRKCSGKRHRKVYKYYYKLKFLVKDADVLNDDDDDDEDDYNCYDNDEHTKLESGHNEDPDEESDPLHNHGRISVAKRKHNSQRESSPERQLMPIHFATNDDNDSDRLFLMSFVPELSKLPSNINMWARAEIANVMQQAVSCYYNNSIPAAAAANYERDASGDVKRQKISVESIL